MKELSISVEVAATTDEFDDAYYTVMDCTRVDEHHSDVTFPSPATGMDATTFSES
jgi:hypothetical protein